MRFQNTLSVILLFVFSGLFSCNSNTSQKVADRKMPIGNSIKTENQSEPSGDITGPEQKYTDKDFKEHVGDCFERSKYTLPYQGTINPEKANYKILPCEIAGVDDFLCENKGLRYISLPDFEKVNVVLVPMDCGDFSYRYYLLTINDKKVVANQYVEGEWFEPDDDRYKELTTFSIDKNYKISIVTNQIENGNAKLKEKLTYQLMSDGKLRKN
ncbi:hypothetical protein [Mucilaginibacter sp. PAMB04168]|uniref:hypothetical protein n=1 Tax=Mucilaginibacter sp. PAMB04168 TaxID=3138567 RepID=UPI0031F65298